MRPCLFRCPKIAGRSAYPSQFWWEVVRDSSRVGRPLFSGTSANSINEQMNAAMGEVGCCLGREYSPYAFRRSTAEEIKDSGSTSAAIIKSGTWAADGLKSYVDLQRDDALNIPRLLLGALIPKERTRTNLPKGTGAIAPGWKPPLWF